MKTGFLNLIFGVLFSAVMMAQDADHQYLMKGLKGRNLGFFMEPGYSFGQLDEANAHFLSIRAGATVDQQFSIGVFYQQSVNEVEPVSETLPSLYLDYRALGGFLEYALKADKLLHLSFPVYVGLGEVEMDNEAGNVRLGESNFLSIEPAALAALNLSRHITLKVGAGYIFHSGFTYRNLDQSDVNGLRFHTALKVRLFSIRANR